MLLLNSDRIILLVIFRELLILWLIIWEIILNLIDLINFRIYYWIKLNLMDLNIDPMDQNPAGFSIKYS